MTFNARNSKLPGLVLIALFVLVLLAACSGGNIDVAIGGATLPPGTIPPFPNNEPVTAHGTVSGFDGLTVNGVRYSANGATILIDSEPGTLADLRIGQVVTVTGRFNSGWMTGVADTIRADSRVTGPVEVIDTANRRLRVMGQPVRFRPDTHYSTAIDPDTLDGLSVGDTVRISGYTDAAGAIRATRIDHAGAPLQLTGTVGGLDIGSLTFDIHQLTVDYGSAVLIDLPGGAPDNGMRLRAVGTLANGVFMAEQLIAAPAFTGNTGRQAQIAGMVTRFASPADFSVGETDITAHSATAYGNGDRNDLLLNAEVTIEGMFGSGGRVLADRITFGRLAGGTTKLVYDVTGFTEISVPTVLGITVSRGSEYSVEVIIDADDAGRVSVTKNGARLTLSLQSGNGEINTLEARITMPELARIDLTGVVSARLYDFEQAQMIVNVGGVSNLRGDGLQIGHVKATVSGVSLLDLGDIRPIGAADITISGVSQATLNMDVGATMRGSVATGQGSGNSILFWYGTNVINSVTSAWNASLVWLGDTKP